MTEKHAKKQPKKDGRGGLRPGMTPWKPGQSGNPKGRPPKAVCLTDTMRSYLDGTIDTANGTLTRAEALVRAVYAKAMKGDVSAQKLMLNYVDGMPIQKVEQTNINPVTEITLIRPDES